MVRECLPLNAHSPAAFYESFPPEEARRLSKKIEFVYTPVHGSWLNMVEIELSVLVRQCLKRRIPDIETLGREAEAWCEERNRSGTRSTGASPSPMPASSCASFIHRSMIDGGLVRVETSRVYLGLCRRNGLSI